MKSTLFSSEVAEPYAQALMSLAQSQNLTESFDNDIRALLGLLEASPELRSLTNNPTLSEESKKNILRQVMGNESSPYLVNFLMLLVDKKRLMFLEPICQQFLVLLRKLTNTVLAEVTSAQALNDGQRQAMIDKVKQLTHAQSVELKESVDSDLIGGVVIRVGSEVYDTSLKGQLRRLNLSLAKSI